MPYAHEQMTFFDTLFHDTRTTCTSIAIVTHAVPGNDDFIIDIQKKFRIACFIPKPNSINAKTLQRIESCAPVLRYTRHMIQDNHEAFAQKIEDVTDGESLAVIDTGGYFCPLLLSLRRRLGERFLGVVEDTENGHQRYEALVRGAKGENIPCPIASAARSPLKAPEDHLVGQAIVFSADALLRECGQIMAGKLACVFGYGKIGSSLAENLRQRGAQVTVIDSNPARQALALAHGYKCPRHSEHLEESQLIFGATGCRALRRCDLQRLRPGCYIFTATSGDDEIEDYRDILADCTSTNHPKISAFGNKRIVFICNNGNSANFMHGGVVGPFIKLVQAELLYAAATITGFETGRINELDHETRCMIAQRWLDFYAHP